MHIVTVETEVFLIIAYIYNSTSKEIHTPNPLLLILAIDFKIKHRETKNRIIDIYKKLSDFFQNVLLDSNMFDHAESDVIKTPTYPIE